MRFALTSVLVLAIVTAFCFAQADEAMPKRYENTSWYRITHVDYKPEHADDAIAMVHDHFIPAARAAGLPRARVLEYATGGEWDVTFIFEMPDGPEGMTWERHPNSIKWMGALASHAGSMEAAQEMLGEYGSMVARHQEDIVREQN